MKIFLIFCGILFYSSIVLSKEIDLPVNSTIIAIAPTGIDENSLGEGFDINFNSLNFKVAKGKAKSIHEARYTLNYQQIDNIEELKANAQLFNLFKGSLKDIDAKRNVMLNIYCIDKTITFEPSESIKSNADYYISKIYYGWSLNYALNGDKNELTAEISSKIQKLIGTGLNFNQLALTSKLQIELQLIGLESKNDGVIIAKSPEETIGKFIKSKIPVPILIEYKSLKEIKTKQLDWEDEAFTDGKYKLDNLQYKVSERKSDGKHWDNGIGTMQNPDIMLKAFLDGQEIYTGFGPKNSFDGKVDISKTISFNSKSILKFQFFDKDEISTNDFIGEVEIKFSELSNQHLNEPIYLNTESANQLKQCILSIKKE